jgi:hypothetical protein
MPLITNATVTIKSGQNGTTILVPSADCELEPATGNYYDMLVGLEILNSQSYQVIIDPPGATLSQGDVAQITACDDNPELIGNWTIEALKSQPGMLPTTILYVNQEVTTP